MFSLLEKQSPNDIPVCADAVSTFWIARAFHSATDVDESAIEGHMSKKPRASYGGHLGSRSTWTRQDEEGR